MKTILTLFLIASLVLSPTLAAGAAGEPALQVVATNFPAFDFTRAVAGGRAQVVMLLPPGAEAHSFEPTPRDLIQAQQADLFVYNGGVGEYWAGELLASLGPGAPPSLRMMDAVQAVEEELADGMEDAPHAHGEHGEEDDANGGHGDESEARDLDEHVWTAPQNALLIAQAIARELIRLDPAGRAEYEANLERYRGELLELDQAFRQLVDGAARRVIVLGDRFPMRYFTMAYGLSYYAAFPGCSAQTEPSAKTIAFLVDKIKSDAVPVVFYIEASSQRSARTIAGETGARPLLLHSAHTVTQAELDAGATYLSLMRGNLLTLREALY